jgi:hypothetical protein
MFDQIDRPTAEYRLSQVLTEYMGDACRRSTLAGVIATAADKLARYRRQRDEHKHEGGPVPQFALLSDAYEAVAEAGRMIRSMRATEDDHALERRHGFNIATVIDELWQVSDLIGRRIEHERTRW